MVKSGVDVFGIGTVPLETLLTESMSAAFMSFGRGRNIYSDAIMGSAHLQPVPDQPGLRGVVGPQAITPT